MKQITHQSGFTRGAVMLLAAIAILAFSFQGAYAQSLDFFSNTQSLDQRSNASDGKPGFNPCGNGVVAADGLSCAGSTGAHLLSPTNITTFIKLGPGAVTDNMFGIVSGADASVTPRPTTQCGVVTNASLAGLNCGDLRFDPATQGQTIPTAGTNLTGVMATNEPMDMDSGTGAARHRSQFENGFVWNPTTTAQLLPVNPANMPFTPTANTCTGTSATVIAVCGQQSMIETTALSGTQNSVVSQLTSFNTTNDAAGVMLANPTITWRSSIVQGDVVGTGGAFTQTLQGSFIYNVGLFVAVQYPTGQSFTLRSSGTATTENLP